MLQKEINMLPLSTTAFTPHLHTQGRGDKGLNLQTKVTKSPDAGRNFVDDLNAKASTYSQPAGTYSLYRRCAQPMYSNKPIHFRKHSCLSEAIYGTLKLCTMAAELVHSILAS